MPQGANLPLTYLAGKLLQQQFLPVIEEDVLDGTLANDHKAIVLTSLGVLVLFAAACLTVGTYEFRRHTGQRVDERR